MRRRNVAPLAGGSGCHTAHASSAFRGPGNGGPQGLNLSFEPGILHKSLLEHRFPLVQRGLLGVHNIARGFYIRLRGLCKRVYGFTAEAPHREAEVADPGERQAGWDN